MNAFTKFILTIFPTWTSIHGHIFNLYVPITFKIEVI